MPVALHALRHSLRSVPQRMTESGLERSGKRESCTSFHEVDLRGGCRGENRPACSKKLCASGDFFFFSFWTLFPLFFSFIFLISFLIVFGSFWGAILEPFWYQNRVKMRTCQFFFCFSLGFSILFGIWRVRISSYFCSFFASFF